MVVYIYAWDQAEVIQSKKYGTQTLYYNFQKYVVSDFSSRPYNHWMYTNRALCYLELKQYK